MSSPQRQPQLKLNPDAVRRRASSITGCRELLPTSSVIDGSNNASAAATTTSSICTFLVGCDNNQDNNNLARVTVYCDTGTIATARLAKSSCQVRHVFQRNVTSLDAVERCLRQPAELTAIDWKLVDDDHRPAMTDCRKNLELSTIGMAILRGEREKLVQHLECLTSEDDALETPNNANTTPAPSSLSETNDSSRRINHTNSGMEFQFSLPAGPMKHVDQCLSDISKMNKLVRGVSTNGVGTVFLYGNGGVAYTPNIPRALYHRLSQLRHSKVHANRPAYVSLGTRERYFVAFHDGSFSYKGPKGLDRELRKLSTTPSSVAFGSSYDTFWIVYNDGTWKYSGKSVPIGLEEQLAREGTGAKLSCVNLGPEGEWFLRSREGHVAWGGVSDDLDAAIHELLDHDHVLNFLDFGDGGSYFVSYD